MSLPHGSATDDAWASSISNDAQKEHEDPPLPQQPKQTPALVHDSQVSIVDTIKIDSDDENTVSNPVQHAVIGRLLPLNRPARLALQRLEDGLKASDIDAHHQQFILSNESERYFELSLATLPEYAPMGWRIGKGKPKLRNRGVDLLLLADSDDNVAGGHARFTWIRGGGGFFIVADNMRGKPVVLNGERLMHDQRLIPFQNSIAFGECSFTLRFTQRSPDQEEVFQKNLLHFYTLVLSDPAPMMLPTPSENDTRIGDWILRNPLGRGSYGGVSIVTNAKTGQPAAMKELWCTRLNRRKVHEEVSIVRKLLNVKHKYIGSPFEMYSEKVHREMERRRIMELLDSNWVPNSHDTIEKYLFWSPLGTSTFESLIDSKADVTTRTVFLTQTLEGLAHLHSHQIMHRDIKPTNLTVVRYEPPLCQIVDFGCATSNETMPYDRPGTVPYLAPEQRDQARHDCAVDCWAVALVGILLFGAERWRGQLGEVDLARVKAWIGACESHAALRCCDEMLVWEPRERLTAVQALEGHLREWAYKDYEQEGRKRKVREGSLERMGV